LLLDNNSVWILLILFCSIALKVNIVQSPISAINYRPIVGYLIVYVNIVYMVNIIEIKRDEILK